MFSKGERPMAHDNRTLGRFHLIGIPPAPRGIPQVEVTFDIDANGILHVSAKDLGTGREQKIQITASSGLNEDEIQKMVRESEQNAEEDQKRKQEVESRNRLDSLIYSTQKLLEDNKDKIDDTHRAELEKAIAEAKKAPRGRQPGGDGHRVRPAHQGVAPAGRGNLPYSRTWRLGAGSRAAGPPGVGTASRGRCRRRGVRGRGLQAEQLTVIRRARSPGLPVTRAFVTGPG